MKIKVDKMEKFKGLTVPIMAIRDVSEKFFADTIIGGINDSLGCLMIADSRSSIVIVIIGGEKLAAIIKLPVVALLQKAVW